MMRHESRWSRYRDSWTGVVFLIIVKPERSFVGIEKGSICCGTGNRVRQAVPDSSGPTGADRDDGRGEGSLADGVVLALTYRPRLLSRNRRYLTEGRGALPVDDRVSCERPAIGEDTRHLHHGWHCGGDARHDAEGRIEQLVLRHEEERQAGDEHH